MVSERLANLPPNVIDSQKSCSPRNFAFVWSSTQEMQGTISKASGLLLHDILQLLCQTRQTGCLHLENRAQEFGARMNISAGTLLNISFGPLQDAAALTEVLLIAEWEFDMKPQLESQEPRIQEELSDLLLQCSAAADAFRIKNGVSDRQEWRPQLLDYTIGPDGVTGGFSKEDAEVLAQDLEFFRDAALRLGDRLGGDKVKEIGITEPGQSMAFFFANEVTFASAGVNADLETTISRARNGLKRMSGP